MASFSLMRSKCLFKVAATTFWFCCLCHFGIRKVRSLFDSFKEFEEEESVWEGLFEGAEHSTTIGIELAPCEFGYQSNPQNQWPPFCSDSLDLPPEFMPKARSCRDIQATFPNVPSGFFTVNLGDKYSAIIYCHMDSLCGSPGPWTRIAYLEMSNPVHECPGGFKEYNIGGVRACGRPSSSSSSSSKKGHSIYFDSSLKWYSEICGRASARLFLNKSEGVLGKGTYSSDQKICDIGSKNFYGLNITSGHSHKHVWTYLTSILPDSRGNSTPEVTSNKIEICERPRHTWFISNLTSSNVSGNYIENSLSSPSTSSYETPTNCIFHFPCAHGCSSPYSLGEDNYFCESVVASKAVSLDNALWDGKGCLKEEQPCCEVPGMPWFHRVLKESSNDFLEIKFFSGRNGVQENLLVTDFEIYIK